MTYLVRNEEDIIEDVILFHRHQGVDAFLVMDNLSTDSTRELLHRLSTEVDIEYIFQPDDSYSQGDWLTHMARRAFFEHHADWIIHGDADEFWLPNSSLTLKEFLATIPPGVDVLSVQRYNSVLLDRGENLTGPSAHPRFSTNFLTLSTNCLGSLLPPKCLHRAGPEVIVSQGNHRISGLQGSHDNTNDIRIFHYPYREYSKYRNKIVLGGGAYERNQQLPVQAGRTWREHYKLLDTNGLAQFWEELHISEAELASLTLSRKVFEETRVVTILESQSRLWEQHILQTAIKRLQADTELAVENYYASVNDKLQQLPSEGREANPFYDSLSFKIRGAQRHASQVSSLQDRLCSSELEASFPYLRDLFSLFPGNPGFYGFTTSLLQLLQPQQARQLHRDLHHNYVVMHLSCKQRIRRAQAAKQSFSEADCSFAHVIVIGDQGTHSRTDIKLGFRYENGVLYLPVPDTYEALATKVFYAIMVISLLAKPRYLVKIDDDVGPDNLSLFEDYLDFISSSGAHYAGRAVAPPLHASQLHGWHIGKCHDKSLELRGYQYPFPPVYATGGHGYVLGGKGMEACVYMFMAMKAFFEMDSVEMEDIYIGHAMNAAGIQLESRRIKMPSLTLPGLRRLT